MPIELLSSAAPKSKMSALDLFVNKAGRLRSGWRLVAFITLYFIILSVLWRVSAYGLSVVRVLFARADLDGSLAGNWGYVVQAFVIFTSALSAGWICGRVFEDLPLRALGWAFHRGWGRDLLLGSLLGAASLALAAAIPLLSGSLHFSFTDNALLASSVLKTLLGSAFIFILSAAGEEISFRGYPLQTTLRSWPAGVAVIIPSVLFASVHLGNPNVVPGFTFVNTTLAGIWLSVAYLRTRSLWLPLGLHWSWNWTMGALLGLPVSGITQLASSPLAHGTDTGPVWLTGGAYGIEGGVACTIALIISTIFIWQTKLLSANEELKRFTDEEIPTPARLAAKE